MSSKSGGNNAGEDHEADQAKLRGLKRELLGRKLETRKKRKERSESLRKNFESTLQKMHAHVSKVHVDGLCSTKDDLVVTGIIDKLLSAQTYEEVMDKTSAAHRQLKQLGCFKKVDATIDYNETTEDLEVTFKVEEMAPTYVHGRLKTGDNEVLGVARCGIPNFTGRGERVEGDYTMGSFGTRGGQLHYKLPMRRSLFEACLAQWHRPMPWSGLNCGENSLAFSAQLAPMPWLTQLVRWETNWRTLSPIDCLAVGFAGREASGHSLKSSLLHKLSVDTRDDAPLPSKGLLATFSQELAGFGLGDVAFFKTLGHVAATWPLSQKVSAGISAAVGSVSPLNNSILYPCDLFHTGGPLMMRAFANNKMGPQEDELHLGGTAFWRATLHAYFALPYLRGSNWLTENVQGHGFLEMGSLSNPVSKSVSKIFGDTVRISSGLGLVVRLGKYGRAELNYCWPMAWKKGQDVPHHGLQFGIGVDYS